MNKNNSVSIARMLVRLNNMNINASVSIARTLVRLNIMNKDHGVCTFSDCRGRRDEDVVVDGGTKSPMSGGGTFLLKMRRVCWRRRRLLVHGWRGYGGVVVVRKGKNQLTTL
jgi:hypothetical protein